MKIRIITGAWFFVTAIISILLANFALTGGINFENSEKFISWIILIIVVPLIAILVAGIPITRSKFSFIFRGISLGALVALSALIITAVLHAIIIMIGLDEPADKVHKIITGIIMIPLAIIDALSIEGILQIVIFIVSGVILCALVKPEKSDQ